MVQLTRWLTGWVDFEIAGRKKGQAERFLTLESRSGVWFWGMKPEGEKGVFRCRVRASEYAGLRPGARKCGVRLHLIKKHGLFFQCRRFGKRKGLLVGAMLFFILIWVLSGRYWLVTVSGNSQLAQSTILAAAQEEGLFPGAGRKGIDAKSVASALMEKFPEIGWVSVNTQGCSAEICLEEGVPVPETSEKEPANILACQDGVILSMDVFSGTPAVQVGDGVVKGQLLISGIWEGERGGMTISHASGNVIARTSRTFSARIPLLQTETVETGAVRYRKSLSVFGVNLPLTLRKEPQGLWQRERFCHSLSLLDTDLPVSVVEEKWTEYKQVERMLTREEAEEKAWDAVTVQQREQLGKDGRVLSQKSSTALKDGVLILTVTAQCRENIGVLQEILFE